MLSFEVSAVIMLLIMNHLLCVAVPAENIWKGVTSVSNAGRKRGRASGGRKKIAKDLNKGQIIGVG